MGDDLRLSLKKADKNEHAGFLWRLRNQKGVRENSFCQDRVSYREHMDWLDSISKDKNVYLYIIQKEGCPIGQVRFDKKGKAAWINQVGHEAGDVLAHLC